MTRRPKTPPPSKSTRSEDLRERVLADFAALKIPLREAAFDAVVAQAEREGLSHLAFLQRLIAEQAEQRRERSIAYRVRDARFREAKTLATFDWLFNAKTIDRSRAEALATGEFIRRRENLVLPGQSGGGWNRRKRPACSTKSSMPGIPDTRRRWSRTSTSVPGASTSAIRRWQWP